MGCDPAINLTLVHGTWGRGIFPSRRVSRSPFWFEPGSLFRSRLKEELDRRALEVNVQYILWSGSNSIKARSDAAEGLSARISYLDSDPINSFHFIVAHSHGGNITFKAINDCELVNHKTHCCYVAVPFLQLFARDNDIYDKSSFLVGIGTLVSGLVFFGPQILNFLLLKLGFDKEITESIRVYTMLSIVNVTLLSVILTSAWFSSSLRAYYADKLIRYANSNSNNSAKGETLILRAVDDEASLAIAAGYFVNFLSEKMLVFAAFILFMSSILILAYDEKSTMGPYFHEYSSYIIYYSYMSIFICMIMTIFARCVYGRELFFTPPNLQMNVHSVPDNIGQCDVKTLAWLDRRASGVRHGLYNHPEAAVIVANWINHVVTRSLARSVANAGLDATATTSPSVPSAPPR